MTVMQWHPTVRAHVADRVRLAVWRSHQQQRLAEQRFGHHLAVPQTPARDG
jgi:hypothetical protein